MVTTRRQHRKDLHASIKRKRDSADDRMQIATDELPFSANYVGHLQDMQRVHKKILKRARYNVAYDYKQYHIIPADEMARVMHERESRKSNFYITGLPVNGDNFTVKDIREINDNKHFIEQAHYGDRIVKHYKAQEVDAQKDVNLNVLHLMQQGGLMQPSGDFQQL